MPNAYWLIGLTAFVVIGQGNYFSFGFMTVDNRPFLFLSQVEKCIDELCKAAKDPVNQLAAQKFIAVVHHLRKCNKVTLEKQVEKMLTRQDETER